MTHDDADLTEVLRVDANDPGCDACARRFEQIAEAMVLGLDAERLFPDVAAHLRACASCSEDLTGLIDAIMAFGDPPPPVRASEDLGLTQAMGLPVAVTRPLPRQKAPTLDVPELGGGSFILAEQRPQLFTMIVFFRGLHCPVCHAQLRELDRRSPELTQRGIEAIAISGETLDRSKQLASEWKIERLKIGYDLPEPMMRAWGLFLSRGMSADEPPLFNEPGLFLVDAQTRIYYEAILSMPVGRPRLDELLRAIEYWTETGYPARGEA